MSTPPLSRSSSGSNLVPGSDTGGDRQESPRPSSGLSTGARPAMQPQNAAPVPAPAKAPAVSPGGAALPSSTPVLKATLVTPGTRATPTVSASTASTSTPASSSSSTSAVPPAKSYDKGNVSGDQLPEKLANALRASWQGWTDVPKRTDPNVMLRVPVFNLPPKQIARLLVGMESNFYQEDLSGLKVREPLRNKFEIRNFKVNDSLTIPVINVIDDILMPFVTKVFGDADSEAARQAVKAAFEEFAEGSHKNLLLDKDPSKSEKASAAQKNIAFRTQFEPVTRAFLDYVGGEKGGFDSSRLPAQFKAYIEEIDVCYTQWVAAADSARSSTASATSTATQPPGGIPPHLAAKKNALIGAMLTRGLLLAWQQKFMNEARAPGVADSTIGKHFMLLMTHLGHFASLRLDAFLLDIMGRHEDLPPDLQAGFDNLATGAKLKMAEDTANRRKARNEQRRQLSRAQTVSEPSRNGPETPRNAPETPRKGGLSGMISAILSPRREEEKAAPATPVATVTPVSPRSPKVRPSLTSTEGILLKNAQSRATTSRVNHRKEIKDYLKRIALPAFDLGYVAFLNKAIERRKNFETFEVAPAAFCLMQLKAYVKELNVAPDALPPAIEKIAQHLNELVRKERETAETAGKGEAVAARPASGATAAPPSAWRTAAPTAAPTSTRPNATTTLSSTSATPASPAPARANPGGSLKLDLSALKSPFAEDAAPEPAPDRTPATSTSAQPAPNQSTSSEGADTDSAKSEERSGNQ